MYLGDGVILDVDAFELRRNGQAADLEPQALAVLVHLVEHRHRLVTKEELLDEVWGGRFVSESALTTRIKQVRRAVGDDGATQRMIRTVRGRGYRYVGPADADPPTTEPARLDNLPAERSRMVGRDQELAMASSLVADHRLVTLLGIGGVGKTTLAASVGRALRGRFAGGVWFVDLVPVAEGGQLARAIADAVGLSVTGGPAVERLAAGVGVGEMLIILDNCENLIADVAATVDQLLDAAPSLRFLVTSREPLGLPDERRLLVGPLPPTDDAAVALLVACAERYGVPLGAAQREMAGEVCRQLDGLPLAIELAAAQLRHLSIADLSTRLHQRFALLSSPRQDRHRSLGVVFADTWATLTPAERAALGQLAAFPGTFSLGDLVDILDGPEHGSLETLGRLVDRSLVTRVPDGDGRYRVLETVRAFADEAADEAERRSRADRLADWCLERVGTGVVGHCLDYAVADWCTAHFDAIRASEVRLGRSRPADAAILVAATGLAMHLDDGNRAAEMLARVEAHLGGAVDAGARAGLHLAGTFSAMAARAPTALRRHGEAAVDEARLGADAATLGIALVLRSWAAAVPDPELALDLVAEAGAVAADAGEPRVVDLAEGYRSWYLALQGHHEEAAGVASAVVARTSTVSGYESDAAAVAVITCLALKDPAEAERLYRIRADRPLVRQMWANRILLATIHAAAGNVEATAGIVTRLHAELGRAGQSAMPDALIPVAVLARTLGADDRARRYAAAIRSWPQPTQSLHATCLYRQLRAALGSVDRTVDVDVGVVGPEAMEWLGSQARVAAV